MKTIGVLAMQGAYEKHCIMLETLGQKSKLVYTKEDVDAIDGLIIPGGESTTIGKLLVKYNIIDCILERIKNGMPIFGTCAGMILLAKDIQDSDQQRLGLMDITVSRNAYGSQKESFETEVYIPALGDELYKCIFIRAPRIVAYEDNIDVMAVFGGSPILVKQDNMLAASFHPELTGDTRIHKMFIDILLSSNNL